MWVVSCGRETAENNTVMTICAQVFGVDSGKNGMIALLPVGARHGGETVEAGVCMLGVGCGGRGRVVSGDRGGVGIQLPLSIASFQWHPACSSEQKVKGWEREEDVFIHLHGAGKTPLSPL